MEFGHEVDQGFKDTSNNTSGADIPDLRIEPDKPKASEERVKEPAVSEDMLPNFPDGVLGTPRTEPTEIHPDAKHRDSGQPEPERSETHTEGKSNADDREAPHQTAPGDGGDIPPPKDPPETAQGGEYDEGDENREGNGNNDRRDDVLDGMRAAAESKKPGEGQKPPIPAPREPLDDKQTKTPVDSGTLGTSLGEIAEREAAKTPETSEKTDSSDTPTVHRPTQEEANQGVEDIRGFDTTDPNQGNRPGELSDEELDAIMDETGLDPLSDAEQAVHDAAEKAEQARDEELQKKLDEARKIFGPIFRELFSDPEGAEAAREQAAFNAEFEKIVEGLKNDAMRDHKETDGSEMPGPRGLEAQLGDNVNEELHRSDKDEVYNSPNTPRGTDPSEIESDAEANPSDNPLADKNLSSEELRKLAMDYFRANPNPDPTTLSDIARQMREAVAREQAQTNNPETPTDQGQSSNGEDTPPTDNPDDPDQAG